MTKAHHQGCLFNFINSLYKEKSVDFNSILIDLDNYRLNRNNIGLLQTVRKTIQFILFDYYTNLNINIRSELKAIMNEFWVSSNSETSEYLTHGTNDTLNDVIHKTVHQNKVYEVTTKTGEMNSKDQIKYLITPTRTTKNEIKLISNLSIKNSQLKTHPTFTRDVLKPSKLSLMNMNKIMTINTNKMKNINSENNFGVKDEYRKTYKSRTDNTKKNTKIKQMNKTTRLNNSKRRYSVFIEVMTMKPFVPKKTNSSEKSKFKINFKKYLNRSKAEFEEKSTHTQHPFDFLIGSSSEHKESIYLSTVWRSAFTRYLRIASDTLNIKYNQSHYTHESESDEDNKTNFTVNYNFVIGKKYLARLRHLENKLRAVKNSFPALLPKKKGEEE